MELQGRSRGGDGGWEHSVTLVYGKQKQLFSVHSSPSSRSKITQRRSTSQFPSFHFYHTISVTTLVTKSDKTPSHPPSSAMCSQNDKPASSVWDTNTNTHCGMTEGVCQVIGRRPLWVNDTTYPPCVYLHPSQRPPQHPTVCQPFTVSLLPTPTSTCPWYSPFWLERWGELKVIDKLSPLLFYLIHLTILELETECVWPLLRCSSLVNIKFM